MNPRTKFFRGLALIGALGVGLAACEDTIVNVEQQPAISASPSTMSLTVGQSQAIVASLTGLTGGVTYTSTAPAVATVSAEGLVTAVAPGSATIQVASQTDPNIKTGVGVVVTAATLPPSGDAEVAIQQITVGDTNTPADPENITNRIDVMMSVSRGDADRLVVLLNGEEVGSCSQSFGNAAAAAELTAANLQLAPNQRSVVCSINTAAFNAQTGEVTFLNDSYDLVVELRKGAEVLDRARVDNLQFNNIDRVVADIATDGATANDADGVEWTSGSVTVRAIPVMFSGREVSTLDLSATGPGLNVQETLAAPFEIVLSDDENAADGGVADFEGALNVAITRVVSGGSVRSVVATNATVALDNELTDAGALDLTAQNLASAQPVLCCNNNWVGNGYQFAAGKSGESDDGVGLGANAVTFHVGPASETDAQIAARPAVNGAADLAESRTNTAYGVVAVVTDLLGNSARVRLASPIGVDLTAPTIDFDGTSVAERQIFNLSTGLVAPGNSFIVSSSDVSTDPAAAPSGFAGQPVQAIVERWAPGVTVLADRCPVAQRTATACFMTATNGTTAVPSLPGYYVYRAQVVDRAGNVSEQVTRTVLVDQDAAAGLPAFGNVVIPSTLVGGQAASFSVDVSDDVNLHRGDVRIAFGAGLDDELPFEAPAILNGQWPAARGDLLASSALSRSITFVRNLQETDGNGLPIGGFAQAGRIVFRSQDAALNENDVSGAITATIPTGTSFADPDRGVGAFEIDGVDNVCNAAGDDACAAGLTSLNLTATATGATGTFDNPFAAVHFYRVDVNGVVRLIGTATSATVTDNGANRVWTWTAPSFSAIGLPKQEAADLGPGEVAGSIFAVGVHSSGDALRSQSDAFDVVEPI